MPQIVTRDGKLALTRTSDETQENADTISLRDRIATARQWIAQAQANDEIALNAGADGYTAAENKQVNDLLLNQMHTTLELLDKVLAFLWYEARP